MKVTKLPLRYPKEHFLPQQQEAIAHAYEFAAAAHEGQKRKSGKSYITHPLAVAETVAEWGLDDEAICAALLHDTVEDTGVTLEDVTREFGPTVAELVDGVTKLLALDAMPSPEEGSARLQSSNENLRKLLLATSRDFRVILIKLADRLHNLRTLGYLSPEKRQRIARESLEVYAPLADRLGMGQLKCEIEDLSFKHARPDEYAELFQEVAITARKAQRYLARLKREITEQLEAGGVTPLSIEGRQKHLYSIFKKLAKVDGDIDKIYDLMAVRIIVPDVAACYQTLGILHQHYKPLIYRIKDYIAVPKPNGYQSLHTTVFASGGRITEIQIRTPQMHEEAEHGLAAHFYYDAQKTSQAYLKGGGAGVLPKELGWVSQLAKLNSESQSGQDFLEGAKLELFGDRIFAFSPKGDLYDLPEGATPVDFAFAIHSGVGLRTLGAKVNGRMVPLDTKLENRDVVEVLTRREAAPNRDWLSFVRTSAAKSRIRAWFRAANREANIASGRAALETELKTWGIKRFEDVPVARLADALDALHIRSAEELLLAVGEGSQGVQSVVRRLVPDAARPVGVAVVKRPEVTGRVLVEGSRLPYALAPCCRPVFPQSIIGYITRGMGVTVHASGCPNLPSDEERYTNCHWETQTEAAERIVCRVQVEGLNRIGLISDIAGIASRHRLNIGHFTTRHVDGGMRSEIAFDLELPDLFSLSQMLRRFEQVPGVLSAHRLT